MGGAGRAGGRGWSWSSWLYPSGEGRKGRGAHKGLGTEILSESLLGLEVRWLGGNCPLYLPVHRDKFQKEKVSPTVIYNDN